MRIHRAFEYALPSLDPQRAVELIAAERLAAARIEPVLRHGHDEAVLDLVFARDGRIAVVPTVIVPTRQVALREADPLIWPSAAARTIDDARADAIRDRLFPWLAQTFTGRALHGECFMLFDRAIEATWQAARSRGFLGAAPLAQAWEAAAPCVYARRFARDRRVAITAVALPGAYALGEIAGEIVARGIDRESQRLAEHWFGLAFADGEGPVDVLIAQAELAQVADGEPPPVRIWIGEGPGRRIPVAQAIPFEVGFSFSERRAPASCVLSVELEERVPTAPRVRIPRGGSSGRVLIAVRADARRLPDADTDEADALAERLRASGLEVSVASASTVEGFDLVHVVGLEDPHATRSLLSAARAAGIPTVVSPLLDDRGPEGWWGSEVCDACFSLRPDEANVEGLLELLAYRRLASTAGRRPTDGLLQEFGDAIRDGLRLADAVIAMTPGEAQSIRERFAYRGPIEVCGPLLPLREPEPVEAITGGAPFALLCAPLEPRSNALAVLRAADAAGIPLVVAGYAASAGYAALLGEFARRYGIIVEDPSPGVEAGLLASARVYVDCAWLSRGPGRVVRAAAAGAVVVGPQSGWTGELVAAETADVASVDSIAAALRTAWVRAGTPSTTGGTADERAFAGILGVYAKLAAHRVGEPVADLIK